MTDHAFKIKFLETYDIVAEACSDTYLMEAISFTIWHPPRVYCFFMTFSMEEHARKKKKGVKISLSFRHNRSQRVSSVRMRTE